MRLHRLEVTAFGPFADTARIDLDALSEAGLFLLTGPTGAGKSSVLDAVCFALYGDVPGDRATAKRLRSDHAGDDVVPRVVLEVTLSGRRFRIDRSPAWRRPKKRGTGTTPEQARVVVSERRRADDGQEAWHPLTTRLDEAGHLLTRLVGMTLPQFCQVALLPQGRFQAFLRARSEERHALLQQVFRTERFDQVERWLRERRVELRRTSEAHRGAVADLASRVSEVGAVTAPADWPDDPDQLVAWSRGLERDTLDAVSRQHAVVAAAADVESAAAAAAAAGTELAGRRAAHAAAEREREVLRAAEPEQRGRRDRVAAAERALAVHPLHEVARAAQAEAVAAERLTARLRDDLVAALGDGSAVDERSAVTRHLRDATRRLADLERVRPLRDRADALDHELAVLQRGRVEVASRLDVTVARADELPGLLDGLAPLLLRAAEARTAVPGLEAEVAALAARQRAATTVAALTTQVVAAERELLAATTARLSARERLVEVREQRLDGMAAEIAARLAVGDSCPVCGSADHPSPAAPAPGAPDEAMERAARREVDDLEVVVEAHAQQVRGLEARRTAAAAEAGGSEPDLAALRADLDARLAAARADGRDADLLTRRADALRAELAAVTTEVADLRADLARHDTEAAVLTARRDDLHDQVSRALADGDDLDDLDRRLRHVEDLATRLLDAGADQERARGAADRSAAAVDAAALEHGFASATDAEAAWLAAGAVADLRRLLEEHERGLARVEEQLADPDLLAAQASPPPDLEALAREQHRTRAAAATARQHAAALDDRSRRLAGLADEVEGALARWRPVRRDLDTVADLAALVEGKHPDNQLQMRLSAYVLAHRLGQVVEAANLRLSTMSDRRYSLVHTGRRGAGETRGGLSLLVRDDWTGDSRDPATLSGGETFVVSLALALGLADVITDEAGGADLDTLFVDEGFGSLDADTLEDVMDTLDALRDGGRVVGVVSHVPELQTRIPTQLRVHRGRHGSRVSLHCG